MTATADVLDSLVQSSTHYMRSGEFAFAKSYLLTAEALAPDNLLIKHEMYKMCKAEGNADEAAIQFEQLFSQTSLQSPPPIVTQSNTRSTKKNADALALQKQYQHLKQLFIGEMKLILLAISAEWSRISSGKVDKYFAIETQASVNGGATKCLTFGRQIFSRLNKSVAINCLLRFVTLYTDHLDVVIDILLYIIVKYAADLPETMSECANRLIEIKRRLESRNRNDDYDHGDDDDADQAADRQRLLQHLRKMYIFHILTALFSSSSSSSNPSIISSSSSSSSSNGIRQNSVEMHFFDALKYYLEDFAFTAAKSKSKSKTKTKPKPMNTCSVITKIKKEEVKEEEEENDNNNDNNNNNNNQDQEEEKEKEEEEEEEVDLHNRKREEYEQKLIEIIRAISIRNNWPPIFGCTKSSSSTNQAKSTEFTVSAERMDSTLSAIAAFIDSRAIIRAAKSGKALDLSGSKICATNLVAVVEDNEADANSSDDIEPILYHCLLLYAVCFTRHISTADDVVLIERLFHSLPLSSGNAFSYNNDCKNQTFPPSKKRKLMESYAQQQLPPRLLAADAGAADNMHALIRLHQYFDGFLNKHFAKFVDHVGMRENRRYAQMQIDILLYGGAYQEALKRLQAIAIAAQPESRRIARNNSIAIKSESAMMMMIDENVNKNDSIGGDDDDANIATIVSRHLQLMLINYRLADQAAAIAAAFQLIELIATNVGGMRTFLLSATGKNRILEKNEIISEIDPECAKPSCEPFVYCDIDAYLDLAQSSQPQSSRQLIFLPLTLENVISFVIDLMVCSLKDSLLLSPANHHHHPHHHNYHLGHMIVLSQFSWPYYYPLFMQVMQHIRNNQKHPDGTSALASSGSSSSSGGNKFAFPLFTAYVHTSDIIECFSSIVEDEEATLLLELNPIVADDPNQPLNMHSTRGVTRTYREDTRNLLAKQMANLIANDRESSALSVDMFIEFLRHEIKPLFIKDF